MAISINANEFLAIAEQIRHNGAVFYRHLAEYSKNIESQKLLLELAGIQNAAQQSLADMRKTLSDWQKATTHFHPGKDDWMYLAQIADTHVFNLTRDPCDTLTETESPEDILRTAAELEKDSILFFLELKHHVLSRDRSDLIDKVIRQSLNHICQLSLRMEKLKTEVQLV